MLKLLILCTAGVMWAIAKLTEFLHGRFLLAETENMRVFARSCRYGSAALGILATVVFVAETFFGVGTDVMGQTAQQLEAQERRYNEQQQAIDELKKTLAEQAKTRVPQETPKAIKLAEPSPAPEISGSEPAQTSGFVPQQKDDPYLVGVWEGVVYQSNSRYSPYPMEITFFETENDLAYRANYRTLKCGSAGSITREIGPEIFQFNEKITYDERSPGCIDGSFTVQHDPPDKITIRWNTTYDLQTSLQRVR